MKIGQKDLPVTPGWSELVRVRARAPGAGLSGFTVFFITWSIFGFFQLFLSLDVSSISTGKNAFRHSFV
jgi:hypothetical protein